MHRNDLFPDEPPLEAYSRVSNPERFRPLHTRALTLLEALRADYEVTQRSSFELLPWMSPFEHARDPVTLTPAHAMAAPLAVAFTLFPSLVVRFGRWQAASFPSCGCDACHETADSEGERFELLVRNVVAGHFREELEIRRLREPRLLWWLGQDSERSGSYQVLSRPCAAALPETRAGVISWEAWQQRLGSGRS